MKKKRGLFVVIGLILLCLLLGVYLILKKSNTDSDADTNAAAEDAQEEITAVSEDDIESLTFHLNDDEVTWTQNEDGWNLSKLLKNQPFI
ncbi:MAG: hypothetical protein EOM40_12875 [Clostridia bacterium]|nr:hypothetical protein [Clostridia bacterium]